METANIEERLVDEYVSLLRVTEVDMRDKEIRLELGNYFKENE